MDAVQGAVTRAFGSSAGRGHGAAGAAAAAKARFTLDAQPHGKRIVDVLSGGVKLTAKYHHVVVRAARTLLLSPNGSHRAAKSPAADRRLVPRGHG